MSDYIIRHNLADEMLSGIQPESILSRTLHHDQQIKVIAFGFAAGQALSEHTSARPAVLIVLAGQASLSLGDDHFEVGPGTWVHMPPNLPHSVTAHTDLVLLLELM